MSPPDGDANLVCTCDLGYSGEFCETTVNGHLSVPLTVSTIVVIVGLVIFAFVFAKLRQRQKRNKRYLDLLHKINYCGLECLKMFFV